MKIDRIEIESLLEETKKLIESKEDLSAIKSGIEFEDYVTQVIQKIAESRSISVEQTGAQSFPDIILGKTYGVEVKYTKATKWESTGNSIFEGTFRKEVTDQIYVFFGRKNGKRIEIRWKNYEDCLVDIKVTHSPRFYISMEEDDQSIFGQMKITYNEFQKLEQNEKAKKAKEFVKAKLNPGEQVWWLDETEEESVSPKIKEYRSLSPEQKKRIVVECMALFPEIFSNSNSKYLDVSVHLLKKYQLVSPSLRDAFSASGQKEIIVGEERHRLSQIYKKLYELSYEIQKYILESSIETLKEYWANHINPAEITAENKLIVWKRILNRKAENLPSNLTASEIFDEGLKNT